MGKKIKNLITGEIIQKPDPIDEEVVFDGGVMITETDPAGIITYANRKFRELTGYTKEQLIGSPHNINRHPDMPKVGFEDMWKTIKDGNYWEGLVKNMTSSGAYYLVIVWVKPKYDNEGNIVGYIAGRKVPNPEFAQQMLKKYKQLKDKELEDEKSST
ncbi:MAG: aerotaxis receptor Aer [Sulfurovum sp. FS08-3]|nr:MAG: aerotaxis receptor Aer [Sulfurovum sp. FS08-3]